MNDATGGPPASVPTPPSLDLSFDEFETTGPIGGGGTADVFRATVEGRNLDIAIKQPRATVTVDRSVVEEFRREAETWGKLDQHDAVVTVLGSGDGSHPDAALPWLAMEYMDGGDLRERLDDIGLEQGLWIAREITDAVWHAHRQGRTHHDLKPANVLFRRTADGWDAPKVADWELSRALIEHSTSVDGLTPRYAAPEQLRPEAFDGTDERTDIYQLGTLVYELLTGAHPFDDASEGMGLAYAVLEDEPRPPTAAAPSLPSRIDAVLEPALARDPADRYEASLDLRRALTEALETVKAGSETGESSPGTDDPWEREATGSRQDDADSGLAPVAARYEDRSAYQATVRDELTTLVNRIERWGDGTELAAVTARHDGDRIPEPVLRSSCYPWLFETVEEAAGRTYHAAREEAADGE